MEEKHPHSGATYRVEQQSNKTFGVVVTLPDTFPITVTGFATLADAERWIARHKDEVAKGNFLKKRV